MLQEWKIRPLEEVYPFVFLDAIHYKLKEDGRYISKAFYTVLGVRVDGLKGFPEAINSVFPNTEVQLCIVHQIRNSLKYVGSANQSNLPKNLKKSIKLLQKKKLRLSLISLKRNGVKSTLLSLLHGEIRGITSLYISNIQLISEK